MCRCTYSPPFPLKAWPVWTSSQLGRLPQRTPTWILHGEERTVFHQLLIQAVFGSDVPFFHQFAELLHSLLFTALQNDAVVLLRTQKTFLEKFLFVVQNF